jgi:hypothetical protein
MLVGQESNDYFFSCYDPRLTTAEFEKLQGKKQIQRKVGHYNVCRNIM